MTPGAMAALHAACFTTPRPWTEAEFAELLSQPRVFALSEGEAGVLLGRVVADEAELLTLAVAPGARRQGTGRRLVEGFLAEAARHGAMTGFLEVAAGNRAGLALYRACGFVESGRRPGYYHGPHGIEDAVVMRRALDRAGPGPGAAALAGS